MENVVLGAVLTPIVAFMAGAVLVETLTGFLSDKFKKIDTITLSMIVGILLAFYGKFNIMTLAGLEFGWTGNPILETAGIVLGILFSGVILSRGSNAVHDLLSKLKGNKELTWAKREVAELEVAELEAEVVGPQSQAPAFEVDPTDPEY